MGNINIKEYIEFMDFNSKSEGFYLVERHAPTPDEKSIIKNLPYRQGVLDFSMLLGERVFENREISFKFKLFDTPYSQAKLIESNIKQKLMQHGNQKLFDTAIPGHYWFGKCKSVEVEQDYKFKNIEVDIVFDCYPYMFYDEEYFTDIWDDFSLEYGVARYTRFKVDGKLNTTIGNAGSVSVKPEIEADTWLKVVLNGETFNIKPGKNYDFYLSIKPGANPIYFEGNGTIIFRFNEEVMG